MADKVTPAKHEVISVSIKFRPQYFYVDNIANPEPFQNLANENMLNNALT